MKYKVDYETGKSTNLTRNNNILMIVSHPKKRHGGMTALGIREGLSHLLNGKIGVF